jgi:hypothetical protein
MREEDLMREITIHCSARDQDVRVLVTDEPVVYDGQASILDSELLCLEIGERCTGATCMLGAESPTAMDARLAKCGLGPSGRASLMGHCDACDRATELVLSVGGYATCAECGTTRHLEPFPH